MIEVAKASALQLLVLSFFILVFAAGAWWFAGFWGRMWSESYESRAVDRRFLRWQNSLFRGRYPLGHWRKPWSIAYLNGFVVFVRAFVVLILVLYFVAVGRRLIGAMVP